MKLFIVSVIVVKGNQYTGKVDITNVMFKQWSTSLSEAFGEGYLYSKKNYPETEGWGKSSVYAAEIQEAGEVEPYRIKDSWKAEESSLKDNQ